MKVEKIFLANGRVRPLWRFFLSVLLVVMALYGASWVAAFIASPEDLGGWGRSVWSTLLTLPALLAVFKLLTATLDRKPLGSVGLVLCGRWHLELAMGVGIGALMILTVGAAEWAFGVARFSWNAAPPAHLFGWGGATLVLILVAGTNEELMFRGYPFQRLVESIGAPGAVGVLSVLFGLAHLSNPSYTLVSTLNTMLVGIPLAVSYLRTRSLWMPVGIHFAWNFLQGFGLGLPVSGFRVPFSALKAQVSGPILLTGGNYGPEGNLLTTLVVVAVTGFLWRAKGIYISEDMSALVFGPEPPQASSPETAVRLNLSSEPAVVDRPSPK